MNLDFHLKSHIKINSEWISILNIRSKIIKFLERNRIASLWPWIKQWFHRFSTKWQNKNVNNWISSKLKTFGHKWHHQENKNCTEWENIFMNHISDKTNNPIKDWANYLNTSPKKTCRWPTSTWKDNQHH